MNINNSNALIYLSTSFSEQAEKKLIKNLLRMKQFKSSYINRRLASYPISQENERDIIIIELMEKLWGNPASDLTFSIFRDFESIFEIIEKRGHFIHQFEVFLLGCLLINQLRNKDEENIFDLSIGNENTCFNSWLFTSTAHDFGYPLQEANDIATKFSELYEKLNMKQLSEKYLKIHSQSWVQDELELTQIKVYNSFRKKYDAININDYILEGIQRSLDGNNSQKILESLQKENNHGYISAIIFCRNYIEYLTKAKLWNNNKNKYLKKIAAAIALHALPKGFKSEITNINFSLNPLAYILILIDNLQDWNRTLRPSSEWPSYSLNDFEIYSDYINLTYMLEHEDWDNEMKNRVSDALSEKAELLSFLKKPIPPFNFHIHIQYLASDGDTFDTINIAL